MNLGVLQACMRAWRTHDGSSAAVEINNMSRSMFDSIIGSLYNESPVTSSSSLTTEGHSDNAPLSSEEISEAQRLLLTRVMQRADASVV
jgi:hypothetical protein